METSSTILVIFRSNGESTRGSPFLELSTRSNLLSIWSNLLSKLSKRRFMSLSCMGLEYTTSAVANNRFLTSQAALNSIHLAPDLIIRLESGSSLLSISPGFEHLLPLSLPLGTKVYNSRYLGNQILIRGAAGQPSQLGSRVRLVLVVVWRGIWRGRRILRRGRGILRRWRL